MDNFQSRVYRPSEYEYDVLCRSSLKELISHRYNSFIHSNSSDEIDDTLSNVPLHLAAAPNTQHIPHHSAPDPCIPAWKCSSSNCLHPYPDSCPVRTL